MTPAPSQKAQAPWCYKRASGSNRSGGQLGGIRIKSRGEAAIHRRVPEIRPGVRMEESFNRSDGDKVSCNCNGESLNIPEVIAV